MEAAYTLATAVNRQSSRDGRLATVNTLIQLPEFIV